MKKSGYILLALALVVAIGLAGNNYYQTRQTKRANQNQPTLDRSASSGANNQQTDQSDAYILAAVSVSGFDCPSCPALAESAIKETDGVIDAKMTEAGKNSQILYDPLATDLKTIQKSLPEMFKIRLVREEAATSTSLN